jgi:hypothetical protein
MGVWGVFRVVLLVIVLFCLCWLVVVFSICVVVADSLALLQRKLQANY